VRFIFQKPHFCCSGCWCPIIQLSLKVNENHKSHM
jgi:hypothetical protein